MRYSLIALVLIAAPARAASVDMGTMTCQDWIDAEDSAQDLMVAWLRGYIAGHSTSTLFDVSRELADAQALRAYCQGHPQTGVVSAMSQLGK